MNTNESINKIRKGDDYSPDAVIEYLKTNLSNVNPCKNLIPSDRSRGDYFNLQKEVGCSIRNLMKASETAFSRALFNQRFIPINGNLTIMLDYEAVLSEDKSQKVDLLAFDILQNKLIAIEYKYNPHGSDTGIEYGLFESYCYGYLLQKFTSNKSHADLREIVSERLNELNLSYLTVLLGEGHFKTEYILSAPVSYFLEFTKESTRAEKRFKRIVAIENLLLNVSISGTNSAFGGYLPIAEISHNRQTVIRKDVGENTFPFIMTTVPRISFIRETTIEIK